MGKTRTLEGVVRGARWPAVATLSICLWWIGATAVSGQDVPKRLPAIGSGSPAGATADLPGKPWLRSASALDSLWSDYVPPSDQGAIEIEPLAAADIAPVREPAREMVVAHAVRTSADRSCWSWQGLPEGLIYRSYLAGAKEPRFSTAFTHDHRQGRLWDVTLGGRVGIVRYGTRDPRWPEGWQLDIEGAAMPRLHQDHGWTLMASDFRFGLPLTYGRGCRQTKIAYYHLSGHLGDEYMVKFPGATRINYTRDAIVWGESIYWTPDLRLYAEAAWCFSVDEGAEPWEFQFGVDYSPDRPGGRGAPFLALNGHLREEVDFGGNFVLQTGWQWRGRGAGHLIRIGMQYHVGKSDQYEFFDQYEERLGMGLWYDF